MDRIMQSDSTNRSKIVVKATISEDLSGKEDPNVAKLQYLKKRNERLNGLHTRHEILLSSRSRQRNHSSNQNTGYGDLSDLGWMKSTLDGRQPGNQNAKTTSDTSKPISVISNPISGSSRALRSDEPRRV